VRHRDKLMREMRRQKPYFKIEITTFCLRLT
jgi:hypothetical protein